MSVSVHCDPNDPATTILHGHSDIGDGKINRRLVYDANIAAAYWILIGLYRDFDSRKDWGTRTVGDVTANPTHVLQNVSDHLFYQQGFAIRESPRRESLKY